MAHSRMILSAAFYGLARLLEKDGKTALLLRGRAKTLNARLNAVAGLIMLIRHPVRLDEP